MKPDLRCTLRTELSILCYLLFVPRTIAWVQTIGANIRSSPPRSFSPRHPLAKHHIIRNRKIDTSLCVSKEDSIDLYKIVEEQDPEWYREFVANVLGEDLPRSKLVGEPPINTPQVERSEVDLTSTTDESPGARDEGPWRVLSDRKLTVLEQDDTTSLDEIGKRSDESNCTAPNQTHVLPSLTSEVNVTMSSVLGGSQIDFEMPAAEETTPPDSNSVLMKRDTDEILVTTEGKKTEAAPSGSMGTETMGMIDSNTSMAISQRRTQIRTSPSNKRSQFSSLYSQSTQQNVEGGGMKNGGRIEREENLPKNYETAAAPAVKPSNWGHASTDSSRKVGKTTNPLSEGPSSSSGGPDSTKYRLAAESVSKNAKEAVEMGINESEKDKYMVVYRDLYSGSLRAENLTSVTDLGYNTIEIPYLQPDALGLIIEDKIRKPTRGIPQQWQISQSQYEVLRGDIRVVPRKEAQEILQEAHRKKLSASKEAKYSFKGGETGHNDSNPQSVVGAEIRLTEKSRPDHAVPHSTETRRYDRRRRRLEERPVDRERRSRSRLDKKRIFNAREVPRNQAIRLKDDDPPPPDSPLWVDMDTFRDLLRSEAELRLRILGEDWADVVKDESNWRLSLYKEWLWALNRGVGSPVVPRRTDPTRRRSPSETGSLDAKQDGWRRQRRRPRAMVDDLTKSQKSATNRSASRQTDGSPRSDRIRRSENFVNGNSQTSESPTRESKALNNQVSKRRRRSHDSPVGFEQFKATVRQDKATPRMEDDFGEDQRRT